MSPSLSWDMWTGESTTTVDPDLPEMHRCPTCGGVGWLREDGEDEDG